MLAGLAQEMFEARRRVMDAYGGPGDLPEEERGSVGFPRGNSPEEFRANMLAFFKEAQAKISKPVVDRAMPSELRFRAAFHECMLLTQELKKGDHANPLIVSRVDMLQQDIWDRWAAGEGRQSVRLPGLTAEELKHLMGGSELAAIHARPAEQTPPAADRLVDRSAPPAATSDKFRQKKHLLAWDRPRLRLHGLPEASDHRSIGQIALGALTERPSVAVNLSRVDNCKQQKVKRSCFQP
jgi:hypothetical protein